MAKSLFSVTTHAHTPLDASAAAGTAPATVSNFLTLQSFANFAAMTGAISAAWHALRQLDTALGSLWVPYALAAAWGVISFVMSWEGLRKGRQAGAALAAAFIALVNSLVLAGAVIGTDMAVRGS
jgi:hypothetical protein